VAWSGDWDGDALFRIYSDAGAPLSGEIRTHVWDGDAQVDTAVAQAPDGTIFVAFVDFSGGGGAGGGLNLWGRTFDAAGNAQQAAEFTLLPFANGDQREPRVAADALGRVVMVYQDSIADGSGNAVMCRRYLAGGTPLGAAFQVNVTTASDQLEPRVASAADGSFVVTWTDFSQGTPRIVGRRYDANAIPLGGEFPVSENATFATRSNVACSPNGRHVVAGFDAQSTLTDVFARRYFVSDGPMPYGTGKMNSRGCLPSVGYSGVPTPTGTAPFWITAENVLSQRYGLMFYGVGSAFTPFQGGTLLVAQPLWRVGLQFSNGNPPPIDCSGTFAYDFNTRIRNGFDPTLVPGATVSAQWYYRDFQDPAGFGTGLTNGLRFTICP
jgi:hypothetical protein